MKRMTRHLPNEMSDAVDDLTAIHIALNSLPNIPDPAFRESTRHIALAMLGNVIGRLQTALELVEHD